jgi:hypothetical protein
VYRSPLFDIGQKIHAIKYWKVCHKRCYVMLSFSWELKVEPIDFLGRFNINKKRGNQIKLSQNIAICPSAKGIYKINLPLRLF